MVCPATHSVTVPVPFDPSPRLLRRAHELLDAGNYFGAAIVCREALRVHLVLLVKFYELPIRRRRLTNWYLIQRLRTANVIDGEAGDLLLDALTVCNQVCHCRRVRAGAIRGAIASGYLVCDQSPWRLEAR